MKETPFRQTPLLGLCFNLGLMLIASGLALCLGSVTINLSTVIHTFTAFDSSTAQDIVRNIRLPRILLALLIGGALAVAGALMQALTKNPLAAPSLMGVNAGASLLVVTTTLFFGAASLNTYIWASFLGAGISGLLVYLLGTLGRRGMTSLKLVIAGATISTLFSSLTQGLLVIRDSTLDEVRFWLAGSLIDRNFSMLLQILPYLLAGLLIALLLSRQITTLSLGDDVARGLGQQVAWVKAVTTLLTILLTGAAVAVAGPIGFVGLVVPHIARALVGNDYRWVLPYCIVIGGTLLVLSDLLARLVVRPGEVPVGAITALVGTPVLIWLVRQKARHSA